MRFKPDLFINNLEIAIKRIGSVAKTARKIGVTEGTVRSWRKGNSDPQIQHVVNLADASGVNIAWLAANEGAMESNQVMEERAHYGTKLDMIYRAFYLCEDVLQAKNVELPPSKKIELVKIVAGMIEREEESVVKSNIYQLVALAS